jgi:heat-inducible transcriptional repressor
MLDERKAAILRAVVEEYIETAQPVGSTRVARATEVAVSPATVRNEMVVLEREGYVVQPHTSAGRIPTDKGYRFFVDQLTQPGVLRPGQVQLVREFFNTAHGELEQMLHDTSSLLSRLTNHAAVVVGPSHEAAPIRSVQLVRLAPHLALVVIVLANGVVEKRSLELPQEITDVQLSAAGASMSSQFVGRTLKDLGPVHGTGDLAVDRVVEAAVASLDGGHEDEPDHVFVGGASLMAAAFDAVETVRNVLAILEEQYVVVTLLRDVLDRGLSVAIGAEHGVEPLADCSVVVAPYEVGGEPAGSIGILGPTRMRYDQALAVVGVVSKRLGRRLTEG